MKSFIKLFKKKFTHSYPIVVNGIPKSGSNLLWNIVKSLPYTQNKGSFFLAQRYYKEEDRMNYILENISEIKPGNVFYGHVPYSDLYNQWLSKNKVKQIFVYRDPRAVVVSAFHYILEMKANNHLNYELLKNGTNNEDKLIDIIKGIGEGKNNLIVNDKSLPGIKPIYEEYLPWLTNVNTLAIKYEDLIENSKETTEKIFLFLGFTKKSELCLAQDIFNMGSDPTKSMTYRIGGLDTWRNELNDEHMELFKAIMPDYIMDSYGYKL